MKWLIFSLLIVLSCNSDPVIVDVVKSVDTTGGLEIQIKQVFFTQNNEYYEEPLQNVKVQLYLSLDSFLLKQSFFENDYTSDFEGKVEMQNLEQKQYVISAEYRSEIRVDSVKVVPNSKSFVFITFY